MDCSLGPELVNPWWPLLIQLSVSPRKSLAMPEALSGQDFPHTLPPRFSAAQHLNDTQKRDAQDCADLALLVAKLGQQSLPAPSDDGPKPRQLTLRGRQAARWPRRQAKLASLLRVVGNQVLERRHLALKSGGCPRADDEDHEVLALLKCRGGSVRCPLDHVVSSHRRSHQTETRWARAPRSRRTRWRVDRKVTGTDVADRSLIQY